MNWWPSAFHPSTQHVETWKTNLSILPFALRWTGKHSALCILHSAFECLPAHAISTKNKHLLVIYSIPARGFTATVSVFRGTPPTKPFDCKIWYAEPSLGARTSRRPMSPPSSCGTTARQPSALLPHVRDPSEGWFRHSNALSRDRWADPIGGEPRFSRAHFRLVPGDIIKMPLFSFSQSRCLSLLLVSSCSLHG